jgi:endonuclease/exonuclease/phosphatase family metal-dependent hydrolase
MTWNLWWRFGDRWRERQHGILSTLASVRPDIAGFQEVWGGADTSQAHGFAAELGMHAAYAAPSLPPPPEPPEAPDQAGMEVGVALLSRWPIREVRQRRMPSVHRPEVVALAVTVDHPDGPLHAIVSCLDWDEGAAHRRAQARALAALLTDPARNGPLPVLLTGDFNSPPSTPEMRFLTDVAVDTWAAANRDEPGLTLSTTNPFAPHQMWLTDQRIDYVFARAGDPDHPVTVERAFLAGDSPAGDSTAGDSTADGYPSDHFAVVADLHG